MLSEEARPQILHSLPTNKKRVRLERPKLVCVDGQVVAEAVVIVSPGDPNWWRGMAVRSNGEIRTFRRSRAA